MDIEGLGGETVFTFNNGLVHNYSDLYELTVEQILPLEKAQKSAENLVKGVADSKKILLNVSCTLLVVS
jgi:DNA ligase (NAD+)